MQSILAVYTVMIIKLLPQFFVGSQLYHPASHLVGELWEVMWPQCEGDHSAVPRANVLPNIPSLHGDQLSIGIALPSSALMVSDFQNVGFQYSKLP
jgi:hypothetical protein